MSQESYPSKLKMKVSLYAIIGNLCFVQIFAGRIHAQAQLKTKAVNINSSRNRHNSS